MSPSTGTVRGDERASAFIVGTGRCGSTFLSTLLRDFSSVLSLSELFTVMGGRSALEPDVCDGPELWRRMSVVSDEAWDLLRTEQVREILSTSTRRGETAPLELVPLPHLTHDGGALFAELQRFVPGLPPGRIEARYTDVFEWLSRRLGKRGWVERSGGSLEYLDRLLTLWPNAKIVHLVGDGPTCAVSMSRHPFFRLRVARMVARDEKLDVRRALQQEVPLSRFAAYWSAVLVRGVGRLSRLPRDQVLHVSLQGLLDAPESTLHRVVRFLGGDPMEPRAGAIRARIETRPPWFDSVTESERRAIERMCRPGQRAVRELFTAAGTEHARSQGPTNRGDTVSRAK